MHHCLRGMDAPVRRNGTNAHLEPMRQAYIGIRHRHQQLFTSFEGEDNEDFTLQRYYNLQTSKAPPESQAPVSTGILP